MAAHSKSLANDFGIPPFSIIDARKGWWLERKRLWKAKIGDHGETRSRALFRHGEQVAESTRKITKIGGVSITDPVLAEVLMTWFSREWFGVFDPFSGDSTIGFVAASMGRQFIGLEIRPEQAKVNQSRLEAANLPGKYIAIDAAKMDSRIEDGSVDLVLTCPPYWNLERYKGPHGDLSGMPLNEFRAAYHDILRTTAAKLRSNRFAVFIVGDVRDNAGSLIGLPAFTIHAAQDAGLTLQNELVLLTVCGTAPMRARAPMEKHRRVIRVHQSVLVFFKGDPASIRSELGKVVVQEGLGYV